MQPRIFAVACSLLDINLEDLRILKIFKENNLTADDLASDLFNIFRNPITERLFIQCLLLELSYLAEHMSLDVNEADIAEEVMRLLIIVRFRLEQIKIDNTSLKAICLVNPDTIIFEYYEMRHHGS